MDKSPSNRVFTLLQREIQEYRTSLFWTPIAIAIALAAVMLLSVLLANRITIMGDAMLQVLLQEETAGGMNISINFDDDSSGGDAELSAAGSEVTYTIEKELGPVDEDDWNFSREWRFNPEPDKESATKNGGEVESLNPMLNMLHNFMILILILVSVNYLLGALYNDRKDRSILFWKSLPVSEWEEVLSKFGVALLVAPAIFIAVSILTQLVYTGLAMILVWRMDMDPFQTVLGNIEFGRLLFNQIAGWLLTAAWVAPAYAWLLLASAAARRSPFMLAVAPVIALLILEKFFLGSQYVATALVSHVPHYLSSGDAVGFYFHGPDWSGINYLSLFLGLVFAALALWGAVYLRRYRFEL